MPPKTTQLIQVVAYIRHPAKEKLDAARLRAQQRVGHRITQSTYVGQILDRHLAKLASSSR